MDQAIEVYSLDFDKQYIEEEEVLKRHENFQLSIPEPIYLPLRKPGMEFWRSLKEQDEKKRRIDDFKHKIKEIDDKIHDLDKELKQIQAEKDKDATAVDAEEKKEEEKKDEEQKELRPVEEVETEK